MDYNHICTEEDEMIASQIYGTPYKIVGGGSELCACCGRELKHPVNTAFGILGKDCLVSINAIITRRISREDINQAYQFRVSQIHFDFVENN